MWRCDAHRAWPRHPSGPTAQASWCGPPPHPNDQSLTPCRPLRPMVNPVTSCYLNDVLNTSGCFTQLVKKRSRLQGWEPWSTSRASTPDRRRRHHRARRLREDTQDRRTTRRLCRCQQANATIGVAVAAGGLGDDVVAVLRRAERPLRRRRRPLDAAQGRPMSTNHCGSRQSGSTNSRRTATPSTTSSRGCARSSFPGGTGAAPTCTLPRPSSAAPSASTWRAIETHGTEPGDAKG